METRLPTRLKIPPIIDAVFEIRFNTVVPASSVLPGILFSKMAANTRIEQLPVSQIPELVRANDPNLQYAPVVRLVLDSFTILIGDKSLALACNIPYPGWEKFKAKITELFGYLKESKIVSSVQRYSFKYVDLIPKDIVAQVDSVVKLKLTIGSHNASKNEVFQVRTEFMKDGILNVVQLVSKAKMFLLNGSEKEGFIIDLDTIKNLDTGTTIDMLEEGLSGRLEEIHLANKVLFFRECIDDQTLELLGPIYE